MLAHGFRNGIAPINRKSSAAWNFFAVAFVQIGNPYPETNFVLRRFSSLQCAQGDACTRERA